MKAPVTEFFDACRDLKVALVDEFDEYYPSLVIAVIMAMVATQAMHAVGVRDKVWYCVAGAVCALVAGCSDEN